MRLRTVGKILLYGCAGTLGLMLLLMLGVKLALDRVPQYQEEIKAWVHGKIGYHIAFAHVAPALRWYGPELYFERLELRSKDDQRVLARAAGGRVGADVWQLLRNGTLFAGRVELDAPDIRITRIGPDKFALASEIELGGSDSTLPGLTLDALPAGTLAIRDGLVTLQNWNEALPELALRNVTLDLQRKLGLAARLPTVLGGVLEVDAAMHGAETLDMIPWTALARTRDMAFEGWRRLLPEYLLRLEAGQGAFEIAARGRGASLARADLEFTARGVKTQLNDGPAVEFDQIGGGFSVTHTNDRWTLLGRRVRALRAGHRDPDSSFDVTWRDNAAGLLELQASASYLRIETLLPLAGLLPQKDLRERLEEASPSGEWMETSVEVARPSVGDPWRFKARGNFRGVGFAAVGRSPGLRGLSGTFLGNEGGGRVDIAAPSGQFVWPSQLSQPVDFEGLKTTLYWKRTPQELLIATPAIDFKNQDATFHGVAAWQQPDDGSSPSLMLASTLDNGNVGDAHLYFPRALLAPSAFAWLNRAFIAGRMTHADIVLRGPLTHFPFRDGAGLFLVRTHIDGLTLDYREDWPRAENASLNAEFRNEGLSVHIQSGHFGNLTVNGGEARFVDFKTGELSVNLATSGDAAEALGYLRATPLDGLADHAFSSVEAKGPLQSAVRLFLPLNDIERRRAQVHVQLDGVALSRTGSTLTATEMSGEADIDNGQVAHADVHGKVLGGAFDVQARTPRNRPVTRTILSFNGTLSGDALRTALELPPAFAIGGQTDWHAVLRMSPEPARERSLRIGSSLAGLELNLPEPLAKPVGVTLPMSVEAQWPADADAQIRAVLGPVLRVQATLHYDADGPHLGRAALAFGTDDETALSDTQVLNTGGRIGRLDLAGWLKLYTPDKNSKPLGNFLRTAKLDVSELDYLGLSFMDVALDLAVDDGGWRIGVGGPNVVGRVLVPTGTDQPLSLEFERLKFVDESPAAAQSDTPAPPGNANPRGIPAINFRAAEMTWGERQFGNVQATLTKLDDGISLQRLTVAGANFTVDAKGEWRGAGTGLGRIEGTLASSDVGATLKQLGYDAVLEARTGHVDFDLSWLGAPSTDALSEATGHVQVALDKGQITGLKPGAGRVVGLASIAALPRRLALDFSDLTDKGFAFDTVRGSFDLRDGSAFTDDMLVKGPAAEIGLIGRVGLKTKDYDQTAVVTGNVSSTLPLAAFAGGPVIGAAVLVFTQVFKQPLKGLARGYYRITGTWDNPMVERIKSADAAAATAEAPK
jgi:uncharacterized protein (TIGR02099 family)